MRVRLSCDSTAASPDRDWGFELTAVRAADGEGAGQFDASGRTDVQVVTGFEPGWENRPYIEHREAGVQTGAASPVEWPVTWIAPPAGAGKIYFFAAGNAGDGRYDTLGDYIFTVADSTREPVVAARHWTWGALKQRFR